MCSQYAEHYRELVERYEPAPDVRRRHLRDIHRRQSGSYADGDASGKPCGEKRRESVDGAGSIGRHEKYQRRYDEKRFPAEPVGQHARGHCSGQASGQSDAHGQPLLSRRIGDAEVHFVKWFRTTDYYPVVAEQQSAHRRYGTDENDKRFIEIFH